MLARLPAAVQVPFQAMADDAILDSVRMTLLVMYAFADDDGVVPYTPSQLEVPRDLGSNTIRRHLYQLEEMHYVRTLHLATKLHMPMRERIRGYALTLRPDGERFPGAHKTKRIGSRHWSRKARWA